MASTNSLSSYYEKFLATGEVKCIDDEIPFEIPQGWEWCRFSSIYKTLTDGTHSTPHYTESGIPFLSVKDMSSGILRFNNTKYISENEHIELSKRCHPQKGDLLLSKVGTTGIPLIIETEKEFSIFVSLALIKFTSIPIDKRFLIHLINSPLVQEQVQENTRGVGNKNWVLTAIANTLILLPPLNEQLRISDKIDELSPIISKYAMSQQRLENLNANINGLLRKSILQEAIQGKLIPQIKEEGTAQELLEQIRQEKFQLVKDGKLKKSALTDSVIYKGDDNKYYERINGQVVEIKLPFEYPNSWVVLRLKDVCQLTDGEKRTGKGICLDAKYLRGKSSATIIEKGKFVYSGDNIILVDGENSGEVFTVPQDGYMGSTFKQLWLSSVMWRPYILAFILFYKEELRNSKRGAAIPHLNKELFYNLPIGIPPFAEQQRIAERIYELSQLLK
ncbi:type I restriction endonuclease subunit S [Bacteroides ovatus]|nr:type I restriction endonuclease subunit S [Bacteroides ovatus]KAA4325521.1 type I restriction endonuclease subunit S [Bacteroides ovatus]RYT71100.1 type I restriction endonuclease subunit S [Bacteroides ovatus]